MSQGDAAIPCFIKHLPVKTFDQQRRTNICAETCQLRRLDKNCQIFMQDVEKFRIIQTRVPLFFLFLMAIILSFKDCNEITVNAKVESGGCLRSADVRRWRGGCHFRSRLNRLRCARGRKSVLTVADRCAQQLRQDNYRRHDERRRKCEKKLRISPKQLARNNNGRFYSVDRRANHHLAMHAR